MAAKNDRPSEPQNIDLKISRCFFATPPDPFFSDGMPDAFPRRSFYFEAGTVPGSISFSAPLLRAGRLPLKLLKMIPRR